MREQEVRDLLAQLTYDEKGRLWQLMQSIGFDSSGNGALPFYGGL